jgi:hypothetical protein
MNVNQSDIILPGSQPAALSGNTYQYESVLAGPTPASFHKGGKYVRFSRRSRVSRSRRRSGGSGGRKSRRRVRGGRR